MTIILLSLWLMRQGDNQFWYRTPYYAPTCWEEYWRGHTDGQEALRRDVLAWIEETQRQMNGRPR